MAKKVGNTYFFTGKGKSSGGGGGGDATDAVKYTEQTLTESQQMQARKNQGLYYEEEGLVDKTITFDGDTPPSSDWKDTAFGIVNMDSPTSDLYIKVSDEVPPIDNWGEILNLNGQPKTEEFIEGNNYYLIGTDAYYPDVIVVENDNTTVDNIGVAPKRGIYVGYIVSTNRSMDRTNWELQSPYVSSISYEGTTTTVHQIPAKYIPDMPSGGLEYYEIELVDWTPLQLVSAELVGYTWGDIVNALYAGKLLVFTIKDRNASDGQVSVKIIGGQLSRMTDIEGSEYGMPCVRFPAAYSYLRQGSAGQFVSTTVKDIVIYPDWTQGGDESVVMVGTEDSFSNQ